jgi:hypothetical protein
MGKRTVTIKPRTLIFQRAPLSLARGGLRLVGGWKSDTYSDQLVCYQVNYLLFLHSRALM